MKAEPSEIERLAGLYMDVVEADVHERNSDDLREKLFAAVKADRVARGVVVKPKRGVVGL